MVEFFTLTTYPVKPADSYIKTSFKDWLLQLASNNNNPNILSLTDLDDPGMMAEKVYVSCRHGGCGHGAGQQYTSWDYCGNHHVRAIKVEMFEVALALIRNQRHHNIYVQQALQFEIAAKAMVASYWSALQAWSSFPISGGAIRGISPLYSYWERLKSNRDQLRTHLSTSLTVLESASECEAIAGDISSVSGSLRVVGDAASGFDVTSLAVHVEIDKLQQALREAESSKSILTLRVGTLEEEKKKLDERVRTEDWGARERELVSTFETRLKANQQEEKEKEKQKVARLLGSMLYTLNAKKDRSDLEQFKQYTSFDEMVDMASTLILESLKEKMSSK
jgi:hypothetical protein